MKAFRSIVSAIDYVALAIGILTALAFGGAMLFFVALIGARELKHIIEEMWSNRNDRAILIIVGFACAWCAIRWKDLSPRSSKRRHEEQPGD